MFLFETAVIRLVNIVGVPCILLLFCITAIISRLCNSIPVTVERDLTDAYRLKSIIEDFVTTHTEDTYTTKRKTKLLNECRLNAIVERLFKRPFKKCKPEWLKNPTTGRRLELDLYNAELGLAFEYDGAQHHHFVPHFHVSQDHFKYRQLLDRLKDKLCQTHGVVLVRVPHTITESDMPAYIRGALGYEKCQQLKLDP